MMKTRPTRTPLEELRRTDRSMTQGSLEGRIGEARLIYDADSLLVEETATDENDAPEILFWQDHHVCSASGNQTLTLTHLPIDYSEHLYWNTVYQRSVFWSRTVGSKSVTVLDPDNDLQPGDVLTFEYAYDPSAVETEVV